MKKYVVGVASLLFVSFGAAADDGQKTDPSYDAYNEGRAAAMTIVSDYLKEHGVKIRFASALEMCERPGLAAAVMNKAGKADMSDKISQYIETKGFNSAEAMLEAQNSTASFFAGYKIGYKAGIGLLDNSEKKTLCEAAVKGADEILK